VRDAKGRRLSPRRVLAVAILPALLAGGVAAAGCGLGPGASVGSVELLITRDYGQQRLGHREVGDVKESDTVMRVLDRSADITTRYGGGFVQSIDGLEAGSSGGRPQDWFFYVNGVESPVGAADYSLHGGDRIWWDYRDWAAAMHVPAVVGSWPEPFRHGYEGERHPVQVRCLGAEASCDTARRKIRAAAGAGEARGAPIQVLVGPWSRVRSDPVAGQIERGPGYSGVFAEMKESNGAWSLHGLSADGAPARTFGSNTGLVAATRRYDGAPVWVVTAARPGGVQAAASALESKRLRYHYAVAVEGGRTTPLPVP
jgi:hypothetical protein